MFPLIAMAAMSLAQKKAQNEQNDINQLNQNRVGYNGQPQMTPMGGNINQSNGMGNALSSLSQIYSMFGK